jgi:hypothetical protein
MRTAWRERLLDRLAAAERWGYRPGGSAATEPTALCALALAVAGRARSAERPLAWLAETQAADGSLGVSRSQPAPGWPTCQAILAWTAAARLAGQRGRFTARIERAAAWLLSFSGTTLPRMEQFGHDSTLTGWPWVEGTHSWVEPTAWALLALRAVGRADHPRARQAAALLVDRLLPEGGCNYGNTSVLGQVLRPHLLPSGLCLWALARERDTTGCIDKTADYLARELTAQTPTASLAYGLLGLAAIGRRPAKADDWLQAAAERSLRRPSGDEKLALLVLASHDSANVLFEQTAGVAS